MPRWLVGAAFLAVLAAVCATAMGGLVRAVFPRDGEVVLAVFADTGKLSPGSPVRVHGVDAGTVQDIRLDPGGRSATVQMKVFKDALPVHADARASIRYRTILGGNLAVDLDPGHLGRLGARPIAASRTTNQVELDDVTSTFTPDARRGLRSIVHQAPRALADPQAPALALEQLAGVSPAVGRASKALRGRYAGELRELRHNAAAVTATVQDDRLQEVVADAATTLGATARRQRDLRDALHSAPGALASTRATVTRLDATLALADPLIGRLHRPARDLAPTIRTLRPVVTGADRLLAEAAPLLRSLRPASGNLASAARDTAPLLTGLDPSVRRVADDVLPSLAKVDPVSRRATYEMVGPTFAGLTGAAAPFDAEAHWFRFPAFGGANTVNTFPCRQYVTDPEDPRLVDCGSLVGALDRVLHLPVKRGRR
ncbi:MAG TPA: MlaD family protein [Solirubrobacteraceae bacterium]